MARRVRSDFRASDQRCASLNNREASWNWVSSRIPSDFIERKTCSIRRLSSNSCRNVQSGRNGERSSHKEEAESRHEHRIDPASCRPVRDKMSKVRRFVCYNL
jgi:hypothetical protein